MAEQLLLDPTSEDAANAQLDITGTGYGLLEHHYPQPPIAAQWASSVDTEGSRLGSVKHENRQIQITLDVDGLTALRNLQAKLGKLHREGGTLKRTLSDATVIVFDVLTVEGYDPDFGYTFDLATVTTVSFTLTCLPYGRAPEVTLSDHVETTLPALVFTETGIKGDMPALGRLVIDNDQAAVLQKTLLWGMELIDDSDTAHFNPSTIPLVHQFEGATVTLAGGTTLVAGPAGASGSGSNVASQTGLTTSFAIYATHSSELVGLYRVFARVQVPVTNAGTTQVRVRYGNFGQQDFVANAPATIDATWEGTWRLLDLGLVVATREEFSSGSGPGQWVMLFDALSSTAGDDIFFDYFMFVPTTRSGLLTDSGGVSDATVPSPANGSVIIAHDRVRRYGPGGFIAGYSKPQKYEGDYLLIPPAGSEARAVRFILKFSRGVIATDADSTVDDLSARLRYTPRYLVVPSA